MDDQSTATNVNTATGLSQETENQMRVRFSLLPENIQNLIKSGEYNTPLFQIARDNKLTYEQLENLQLETVMALFGLSTLEEYRSALTDELKKNDEGMEPIMQTLNEKIFDAVKDSLQKFYETSAAAIASDEQEESAGDEEMSVDDALSDEIPADALPTSSNANPFMENASAIPANVSPVSNVIPIKTSPIISAAQSSAPVSAPIFEQPASAVPQFVSNISTRNIGPEETLSSKEKNVLGDAGVVLNDVQSKNSVRSNNKLIFDILIYC